MWQLVGQTPSKRHARECNESGRGVNWTPEHELRIPGCTSAWRLVPHILAAQSIASASSHPRAALTQGSLIRPNCCLAFYNTYARLHAQSASL